jgi:hypothetical protein
MYDGIAEAARITELEEQVEALEDAVADREATISNLSYENGEAERDNDRLYEAIEIASDSLLLLSEVPLKDLEASIQAIVDALREAVD